MPNAERLQGTLDFIKTHPDKHNQCTWVSFEGRPPGQADLSDPDLDPVHGCGTVACFAGWASFLYGPEEGWKPVRLGGEFFEKPGVPVPGGSIHARQLASELLEIDEDTTDYLFCASRTLDELETAVGEIIDGTFVLPNDDYEDWDEDFLDEGQDLQGDDDA